MIIIIPLSAAVVALWLTWMNSDLSISKSLLRKTRIPEKWSVAHRVLPNVRFSNNQQEMFIENIASPRLSFLEQHKNEITSSNISQWPLFEYSAAKIQIADIASVSLISTERPAFSHGMLEFQFRSGRSPLLLSMHARCRENESFDILRAVIGRHYPMMMMVYPSPSYLQLRMQYEQETLYRFPLFLTSNQAQLCFVYLCRQWHDEQRAEAYKYYHTVTNNCCRRLYLAIQYATGLDLPAADAVLFGIESVLARHQLAPADVVSDRKRYRINIS